MRSIGDAYGYHARRESSRLAASFDPVLAVALAIVVAALPAAGSWRRDAGGGDRGCSLALGVFISMRAPDGSSGRGRGRLAIAGRYALRSGSSVLGFHSAYYSVCCFGCLHVVTVVARLDCAPARAGRLALVAPSLLVAWLLMRSSREATLSSAPGSMTLGWRFTQSRSQPPRHGCLALVITVLTLHLGPWRGAPRLRTAVRVSNVTLILVIVAWLLTSERLRSALLCGIGCLGGFSSPSQIGRSADERSRAAPDVIFSIHYVVPSMARHPRLRLGDATHPASPSIRLPH